MAKEFPHPSDIVRWCSQRTRRLHEYFGDWKKPTMDEFTVNSPWNHHEKSPWVGWLNRREKSLSIPKSTCFITFKSSFLACFWSMKSLCFLHIEAPHSTALGAPRVHWTRASGSFRAPLERLEPRKCWSMGFQHHGDFIDYMAIDQYLYIPFLVGWRSISQLFWGSLGTRVLTHPQITCWNHHSSTCDLLGVNSNLFISSNT